MGYNVKVEEVDKLFEWISTYCSETESQLSWAGAAVGHMASLEGFEGAAAQSVKSYFSEVHLSAIGAITLAFEELKMRYAEYAQPYYSDIDSSSEARFEQSAIIQASSDLSSARSDVADKHRALERALSQVSDLVSAWTPSPSGVDDGLWEAAAKARNLDARVSQHEAMHASRARMISSTCSATRALISSYGASASGGVGYAPGSVTSDPSFAAFAAAVVAAGEYVSDEGRVAYVQAANEALAQRSYDRWEKERLEELRTEGFLQFAAALATLAVGAVACFATAGAATPVVIAAWGTFGASAVFQVAEMGEGVDKMRLAVGGDAHTVAYNFMRDGVLGGDQSAYDFLESATLLAAGATASVGVVGAAWAAGGKAAIPSALKEAGKGAAVDFATEKAGGYLGKELYGDTKSAAYFQKAVQGLGGLAGADKKGLENVESSGHGHAPKFDAVTPSKAELIGQQLQAEEYLNGKLFGKDPGSLSLQERRAAQLETNRAQGAEYAAERFAEFKQRYPNAVSEVTIELDDGTRIRVDAIARDEDGNLVIQEYKSSKTASFTTNQKIAYSDDLGIMNQSGRIVGAKGVEALGEGVTIPKGFVVEVVRPG